MVRSSLGLRPTVHSVRRVKPTSEISEPVRADLSIVDATTATFEASSALWVFGASNSRESDAESKDREETLITALAKTLAEYPHFAGRLQLTPWPETAPDTVPHTQRFRRSFVEYGHPSDPGVEVQLAALAGTVEAVFPSSEEQSAPDWHWDLTATNLTELFVPTGEMAGHIKEVPPDSPAVRVRITTFTCGSVALALKIAHPLADAESMIALMKAWGMTHAALMQGQEPSMTKPLFDPRLLDGCAAGEIDGPLPDDELVQVSRSLPLPRYDWWAHEPGNPAFLDNSPQVIIPAEIPPALAEARVHGTRIPWEEWEMAKPVQHRIYRLSADELQSLYQSARSQLPTDPAVTISRHDVLLAFVWHLIARAKPPPTWPVDVHPTMQNNANSDPLISLDTTLGLRSRLGLPSNFVGSPVLLAGLSQPYSQVTGRLSHHIPAPAAPEAEAVSFSTPSNSSAVKEMSATTALNPRDLDSSAGTELSGADSATRHTSGVLDPAAIATTAAVIRRHLATFDHPALAAWLHEQAFEIAPQRIWNGFLGARHTMATSWVRAGVWDVDFGWGAAETTSSVTTTTSPGASPLATGLRWAGVMGPLLDGLVVLTEARGPHKGRDWWRNGVDVDVKIEASAQAKVSAILHQWRAE